ncbi:hypothetical protein WJX74_003695 [Apatococcus lobatus]|uniref:Uncharacterized protein n=1 Tax=Apatococcus lobatus TaxID=904363 RepID=A0AAW1RH02_9CHLO
MLWITELLPHGRGLSRASSEQAAEVVHDDALEAASSGAAASRNQRSIASLHSQNRRSQYIAAPSGTPDFNQAGRVFLQHLRSQSQMLSAMSARLVLSGQKLWCSMARGLYDQAGHKHGLPQKAQKITKAQEGAEGCTDDGAPGSTSTSAVHSGNLPQFDVVSPTREVTLSLILGQCPNLFTEKKISAAEKQITTIDHLPGRYHQAQAVYLSRNSLASLDGLDQFYRLQALSVSDNILETWQALAALTQRPLLPGLQILDGKAVSQAERTAAQGVVQHEGAMLAVMLSSACLCHKLGRAVQMVRLHMELRAAVIGQWGQARYQLQSSWVQPSAACLLQLWHYESTLSWQERDRICSALRREAVRMRHRLIQQRKHGKREPAVMPSWTEAFVEVMRAQQMTIARLLGGFEISKCRAEAHAAKLFGTLAGQRRDSMDATIHDAAFYSEREAIMGEMQRGLSRMADVCADALDSQAVGFQRQIQELQVGLQEAMHMPDGSPTPIGMLHPAPASQPSGPAQSLLNTQSTAHPALRLPPSPSPRTPRLHHTPGTCSSRQGPTSSQPAKNHQVPSENTPQAQQLSGQPQRSRPQASQDEHQHRRADGSVIGSCGPHFSQIHQQHGLQSSNSQTQQQLQEQMYDGTWAWDTPTQQRHAPTSNGSGTFHVASDPVRAQGSYRHEMLVEKNGTSGIAQVKAEFHSAGAKAAEQNDHLAPTSDWELPPDRPAASQEVPTRSIHHTLSMQTQAGEGGQARSSSRPKHMPHSSGSARRPKSAKLVSSTLARVAPARPCSARPVGGNSRSSKQAHQQDLRHQHARGDCGKAEHMPGNADQGAQAAQQGAMPSRESCQPASACAAAWDQSARPLMSDPQQAGGLSNAPSPSRIPKPKPAAVRVTPNSHPQAAHQLPYPSPMHASAGTTLWVATHPTRSTRIKQMAAEIDAQGFTHDMECPITAPRVDDPAGAGTAGQPVSGCLWPERMSQLDGTPAQQVLPSTKESHEAGISRQQMQKAWQCSPDGMQDSSRSSGTVWPGEATSTESCWPGAATSPGIPSSDPVRHQSPAEVPHNQASANSANGLDPELTLAPWQFVEAQPEARDSCSEAQATPRVEAQLVSGALGGPGLTPGLPDDTFLQSSGGACAPAAQHLRVDRPAQPPGMLLSSGEVLVPEWRLTDDQPSEQIQMLPRQRQWWLNNPSLAEIPGNVQPLPMELHYPDARVPWEPSDPAPASHPGSTGLVGMRSDELSCSTIASHHGSLSSDCASAPPDSQVRLGFAWSPELWSHLGPSGSAWPMQQSESDRLPMRGPAYQGGGLLQPGATEAAAQIPQHISQLHGIWSSPEHAHLALSSDEGPAGAAVITGRVTRLETYRLVGISKFAISSSKASAEMTIVWTGRSNGSEGAIILTANLVAGADTVAGHADGASDTSDVRSTSLQTLLDACLSDTGPYARRSASLKPHATSPDVSAAAGEPMQAVQPGTQPISQPSMTGQPSSVQRASSTGRCLFKGGLLQQQQLLCNAEPVSLPLAQMGPALGEGATFGIDALGLGLENQQQFLEACQPLTLPLAQQPSGLVHAGSIMRQLPVNETLPEKLLAASLTPDQSSAGPDCLSDGAEAVLQPHPPLPLQTISSTAEDAAPSMLLQQLFSGPQLHEQSFAPQTRPLLPTSSTADQACASTLPEQLASSPRPASMQQGQQLQHVESTAHQGFQAASPCQSPSLSQANELQGMLSNSDGLQKSSDCCQSAQHNEFQQEAPLRCLASPASALPAPSQMTGSPQLSKQPSELPALLLQHIKRTPSQQPVLLPLPHEWSRQEHTLHTAAPHVDEQSGSHMTCTHRIGECVPQAQEDQVALLQGQTHGESPSASEIAQSSVEVPAPPARQESQGKLQGLAASLQKLLQAPAASQSEAGVDEHNRPADLALAGLDDLQMQGQQSVSAMGKASEILQRSAGDSSKAASVRSSASQATPNQPGSFQELLQQLGRLVDGIRQPSGPNHENAPSMAGLVGTGGAQIVLPAASPAALESDAVLCSTVPHNVPVSQDAAAAQQAVTHIAAMTASDPAASPAARPSASDIKFKRLLLRHTLTLWLDHVRRERCDALSSQHGGSIGSQVNVSQ